MRKIGLMILLAVVLICSACSNGTPDDVTESSSDEVTQGTESNKGAAEEGVVETDVTEQQVSSEQGSTKEGIEETSEEDEVVEMSKEPAIAELHFLGRASVRIDYSDGTVVYIDPAEGDDVGYAKPADLVLVTHQHGDHNRVGKVTLKDNGEVYECPTDFAEGDSFTVKGIEVTAVAAYNDNHKREVSCGLMLTVGDFTIYHSGDTSMIDEMNDFAAYNIDYAMICMDDYYNMGPEEAAEVAELIQPEMVIPIHTSPNGLFDQGVIDRFDFENVVVLEPGMSLELY